MDRYVIYWRGTSEVRADLIKSLKGRGFLVVITRSFNEVLTEIERGTPAALLVDASFNDMEIASRVVTLEKTDGLTTIPIIFFGKRATTLASALTALYELCILIDVPFHIQNLFDQVGKALASRPDSAAGLSEKAPANVSSTIKAVTYRDPSQLVGSNGGAVLSGATSVNDFDDALLLPEHPKKHLLEGVLSSVTNISPEAGVHVRRSTFLSTAVAHSMPEALKGEVVQASSLYLYSGFSGADKDLIALNPLTQNREEILERLAAIVMRSAEQASSALGDERVSTVLAEVSDILNGSNSKSVSDEARVVLLSDLSNRVCWRDGEWNPQGSYGMIRNLRSGRFAPNDSAIVESFGRVIAEAIVSSHTPTSAAFSPFTLSERSKRVGVVEDAMRGAEGLFDAKRLIQIPLKDLQPGMLLGRPLISHDGAVLLEANTRLDRDLLLRIWQMQALRPLHGPALVVRD